jgi:hypothetical protein
MRTVRFEINILIPLVRQFPVLKKRPSPAMCDVSTVTSVIKASLTAILSSAKQL